MNKNDIVTLEITDVAADGAGIGRYEGLAVFVPHTAPGDTIRAKIVKIKSSYAFGIPLEILAPSIDRTENDCPYFFKCGGCVFRHINYNSELKIKQNRVAQALKRIAGVEIPCGGIVGSDLQNAYRNKAQLPFDSLKNTGFFAPRSHRVIPIETCALLPDVLNRIARCVSEFLIENDVTVYDESNGTGLVRHLYIRKGAVSGEIMVVLVINGETLPLADKLTQKLLSLLGKDLKSFQLNINTVRNNVILGDKNVVLYGEPYINDTLCGVTLHLSPFTFYQVNYSIAERLYEKAKEYAAPEGKSVIDLYCGAGAIGLSMAKTAKSVTGVEIVPEAVRDAIKNAEHNGIENADFICGDAKSAADTLAKRKVNADVVILDPPRKGCDAALLETVANDFSPERIVYISCDPGTLARDIKILSEFGYTARGYTVFDMFPRTAHVETVCLLN